MSKLDSEKEKIGVLKFWLGIAVATLLTVAAFCITNYEKTNLYLLIASGLFIIFLVIFILLVSKKINKRIDRLEDL